MTPQVYKQPKPKGRLSPTSSELQREKASACIVVKFNDDNVRRFWSDEAKRPNIKTIEQALAPFWNLFRTRWRNTFKEVAVFDVRVNKKPGPHNKIYQFEDGAWYKVNDY